MLCTIVLSTKLMSADLEVKLLLHPKTSQMFLCCSTIIDFKVDCKLFLLVLLCDLFFPSL